MNPDTTPTPEEPVTGKSVKFSVNPSFSEKCKVCGEAYGDHMGYPDAPNCPKDPFPPKEEPVIQDSRITEPEWRALGEDEVICEGDEFQEKQYDPIKNKWYTIYECSSVGKKVLDSDWGRFRTHRPLPVQEPLFPPVNPKQVLTSEERTEQLKHNSEVARLKEEAKNWHQHYRDEASKAQKCKQAFIEQEKEVARLRELLNRVIETAETISSGGSRACRELHHAKKDRHELGEVCPVEEKIENAIRNLVMLKLEARLAPAPEKPTIKESLTVEPMPGAEIEVIDTPATYSVTEARHATADAIRYLRDEIQKLKETAN